MEAKPELKYIFSNINDWLKFAEAKHAGLVVLNAGIVVGILSSYGDIQNFIFKPATLFGMVSLGISVFLSILSQFPVTHNVFYDRQQVNNPNLYFYGDLSNLDDKTLIDELKKADVSFAPSKFDDAIINQILVNARITQAKLNVFKFCCYLTTFGTGLIGISSIAKIAWRF